MSDILANHMEIISAPPQALAWICDCFANQRAPYSGPGFAWAQSQAIRRMVILGNARAAVAVPVGYHTEYVAWAVELAGSILYAFVREDFRRQGIGAKLACQLVQNAAPIGIGYWTKSAAAIAEHGFPIEWRPELHTKLLAYIGPTDGRIHHGKA